MELSQKELEELVVGKPPAPHVRFFEKARFDPEASRRENKRVYRETVYIEKTFPGVTDFIPRPARKQDFQQYPHEYRSFLENRETETSPLVDIIPGLSLSARQELRDMGIHTLRQLTEAETLPPQFEGARRSAKTILNAMEMTDDGEGSNREAEEDTPQKENVPEDLLALAGRIDGDHEQRREVPAGGGSESATGERAATHRRIDRASGEEVGADFSMEVRYS